MVIENVFAHLKKWRILRERFPGKPTPLERLRMDHQQTKLIIGSLFYLFVAPLNDK